MTNFNKISLWSKERAYIDYLESDEWKLKRAIILKDNAKCELCGYNKKIQLHHKNYENLYKETAEDFIVLCRRCHMKIHGRKEKPKLKVKAKVKKKQSRKRYNFSCEIRYAKPLRYIRPERLKPISKDR